MAENRTTYKDSYSPVIDIPVTSADTNRSTDDANEEIATLDRKKRQAPRSRRVTKQKRQPSKPKASASPTDTPVTLAGRISAFFQSQTFRWLAGIFLGSFAIYLLVAFISYLANCIEDQAAIVNSPIGSLPPVGNSAGEGGARLSEFLINGSFGIGSFVLILWISVMALKLLCGWPRFKTVNFTIKCIVALITVSLIVGLLTLAWNTPVNWGGYHGRYVNEFIIGFCGWIGAAILCMAFVASFFVICLRDVVNWIIRKRNKIAERRREALRIKREQEALERELEEMRLRELEDAVRAGEAAARSKEEAEPDNSMKFEGEEVDIDPSMQGYSLGDEVEPDRYDHPYDTTYDDPADLTYTRPGEDSDDMADESDGYSQSLSGEVAVADKSVEQAPEVAADGFRDTTLSVGAASAAGLVAVPSASDSVDRSNHDDNAADATSGIGADSVDDRADEEADDDFGADRDDAGTASDKSDNAETPGAAAGPSMVVNVNQIAKGDTDASNASSAREAADGSLIRKFYKFPSVGMLRDGEHRITVDVEEQSANKERIRETLLYHKIPITQITATVGPTVTLYEVRPEQGVKIARIKNLADDIALSLAARGVRVIAPIPGKGTVGIEVANAEPQTVSMRTIIDSRAYAETRYRLPVALGSTIGNDVYIADLTKMPHLLVAGATGQGKSVGLNAIIASLLYKKRPDELKFVMIDPKEVEFSLYAKIEGHYLAKLADSEAIVTDMSKVVMTLQSLCREMDNRYKLLREASVRNIEEYNAKYERHQLNPNDGHRFLPYIVLIVDEFADLIMTSGKEVETPIARLAQKARAIGIHVIIATQRPSTNVITGIIKANFPVRIAFKVSSGVDSKTILDTTGAQQLIGKGDMLISNNSEMVRVQCAFIDTPEVESICNYIAAQPFNSGAYILPDPVDMDADGGGGGGMGIESRDPLFEEVADIVVTSGVGSTSGIQRRLSIGYNRAGKIMDQLEHYGVVGPSLGGKPRQVLMDPYGLEQLLKTLNNS